LTALACLRVAVDVESTGLTPAVLGPLVAKFSSLYLESRWLWPRLFESLNHYCYLLTDPRADELDVGELARLSDELQTKLFGTGADGEVALLLFEGTLAAATEFAALDSDSLVAALKDPSLLPKGGRLSRIASPRAEDAEPEVIRERSPDADDTAPPAEAAPDAEHQTMPALEGLQGVYFLPRGLFVGDVVSSTPGHARSHISVLEGVEHLPEDSAAFDADCVLAAVRFLVEGATATIFLPICYSNIVRASHRERYEEMLSVLPAETRTHLTAIVYDTPRNPAFGGLAQIRSTLLKYVSQIDLQTHDPGFEVEYLPDNAVNSVTLVLPDAAPRSRLATLKRFAERRDSYRRKRIWIGVTDVRNQAELAACVAAKVPFVTGAGVCRMQSRPIGGRLLPLDALPILAA